MIIFNAKWFVCAPKSKWIIVHFVAYSHLRNMYATSSCDFNAFLSKRILDYNII